MSQLTTDNKGVKRCNWSSTAPEFIAYHDDEWGFPSVDNFQLFEKLCLESFQSGLSWRTILVKRENFRRAFDHFDFHKVAQFDAQDIERLMADASIVRNKRKIEAVINNAQRAIELTEEFGSLANFLWRYRVQTADDFVAQSITTCPESIALSKDLKKRGWKFLGPTTLFAFMQSMGFINDHVEGCVTHQKVEEALNLLDLPKI